MTRLLVALGALAWLASIANAERLQPEPDPLEGCTLPIAREKLVDIPDEIQFKLSARDRLDIARAIYDDIFPPDNTMPERWEKAYKAWIATGAKMHLRQAVRVAFDLERGLDRIAVVEYEVKGHTFLGILAAPRKRWVALFKVDYHPSSRFIASANIDDDAWIELLFLGRAGGGRKTWWATGQTRVDPDDNFTHLEHTGGKSLSLCPQKS